MQHRKELCKEFKCLQNNEYITIVGKGRRDQDKKNNLLV